MKKVDALTAIEIPFRVKIKPQTLKRNIIVLVDTSGSMFTAIYGTASRPEDLDLAVDYAFSLALSILFQMLSEGVKLDGYLGFFSDKTEDFVYGGLLRDMLLRGGEGDYFKLEELEVSEVSIALSRGRANVRATSGGTDPNPLLHYLLNLAEREIGTIHGVFIVTDGETPPIKLSRKIPLAIHIVPGGSEPEVIHPDPSLVKIYKY